MAYVQMANMAPSYSMFLISLALAGLILCASSNVVDPEEYLRKANAELQVNIKLLIDAQWDQGSNITQENENKLVCAP